MRTYPFGPEHVTPAVREALARRGDELAGLLPAETIRQVEIARPAREVVAGFLALRDLTSTVADILEGFGIDTAIPASVLPPVGAGQRFAGPAVTVRQARVRTLAGDLESRKTAPRLGGLDQITLCEPGDVLLIDAGGVCDASSFGGLMATAAAQKKLGAVVVDGAVRDSESMRAMGLPVWSRSVAPRTGKHRLELVEFNGIVSIGGVQVWPGDLVLGDSDGLLVVPAELAAAILDRTRQAAKREASAVEALQRGAPARESLAILPPEKW